METQPPEAGIHSPDFAKKETEAARNYASKIIKL